MATFNGTFNGGVNIGGESLRFDIERALTGVSAKVDRIVNVAGATSPTAVTLHSHAECEGLTPTYCKGIIILVDPNSLQATAKNVDIVITVTDHSAASKKLAFTVNRNFPLMLCSAQADDDYQAAGLTGFISTITARNIPGTTPTTDDVQVRCILLN